MLIKPVLDDKVVCQQSRSYAEMLHISPQRSGSFKVVSSYLVTLSLIWLLVEVIVFDYVTTSALDDYRSRFSTAQPHPLSTQN